MAVISAGFNYLLGLLRYSGKVYLTFHVEHHTSSYVVFKFCKPWFVFKLYRLLTFLEKALQKKKEYLRIHLCTLIFYGNNSVYTTNKVNHV